MKLLLFNVLTGLFVSSSLYAQQQITLNEASKFIGDSVLVCGKVAAIGYTDKDQIQKRVTFINLTKPFPNQELTIVVWEQIAEQFAKPLDELFFGKRICVRGKLELYQGKPQIVLTSKEQLKLETVDGKKK